MLSGGTVDVSVHEVLEDNNLRELYKASGGAWGGTTVDEDVLIKIFGQNVFTNFKNDNMDDYIDIFRTFEVKKRGISATTEIDTVEEFRIVGFYLYHVTSIRPSNSIGASGSLTTSLNIDYDRGSSSYYR